MKTETIGARSWLWAGSGLLAFFAFATLASAVLMPKAASERGEPFQPPSWAHPFGTDDLGYDLLAMLLQAAPMSLVVGIGAAVAVVAVGTAVGLFAGFARGAGGEALAGLVDVVLLVPMLPFMMLLAAYLSPSVWTVMMAIALIGWCSTARAVRARVLQLREATFIEALTGLGYGRVRIVLRHVLPNVSEIVSAKFVLSVAGAMVSEAALSFLGLGDPVRLSWGKMMHYAYQRGGFANGMWLWYVPPGLCITLCALGFMFLGLYWERRALDSQNPERF